MMKRMGVTFAVAAALGWAGTTQADTIDLAAVETANPRPASGVGVN